MDVKKTDLVWKRKKKQKKTFHSREMSMKWMDTPSVTEMDRGLQGLRGFYEMDTQKKCQKVEMPLKWIKFNNVF